ncbi:NtaA/DmoA family FMN-dependent monooxygenase [Phyllobacterium sp. SB3]|uniref:NtaA/DmoA family FMN-dependent monooxygenase n=1 Tax=Phyllobacterium sp. SB3 TaxID=3156073 RepID=UPI0032AFBD21
MVERKHIRLGFSIWATGFHPAGWRLPEARFDGTFDPRFLTQMARLSEKGKLDFFFIGDRVVGLPETQAEHPNLVLRPEALTLAGYVAGVTERIGIVTTVNTTYSDPFNVARATATVDHLSNGRLAFNIVTGRDPEAAANFGRSEHWATDHRFDNAAEFIDVVKGLWDSWEDDALVGDKANGLFINPSKVHRLNFTGEHYSVAGPLNIARPVQGQIPLLTAGASDRSKEFGAQYADVRFGTALHIEPAKAYYADIKSRLAKYGRAHDEQALVTGIAVYVGHTSREAHYKYREIQNLSVTNYDLGNLATALGVNLASYALDTPVAEIEELAAASVNAQRIIEQAKSSFGDDKIKLRELFLYFRRSGGGAEIVGDAKKVVDVFEEWFEERAADGFILFPPYLPGTAELFVELVIPELQRRGLFRTEYEGTTFRDHFNLPRPANIHTAASNRKLA